MFSQLVTAECELVRKDTKHRDSDAGIINACLLKCLHPHPVPTGEVPILRKPASDAGPAEGFASAPVGLTPGPGPSPGYLDGAKVQSYWDQENKYCALRSPVKIR